MDFPDDDFGMTDAQEVASICDPLVQACMQGLQRRSGLKREPDDMASTMLREWADFPDSRAVITQLLTDSIMGTPKPLDTTITRWAHTYLDDALDATPPRSARQCFTIDGLTKPYYPKPLPVAEDDGYIVRSDAKDANPKWLERIFGQGHAVALGNLLNRILFERLGELPEMRERLQRLAQPAYTPPDFSVSPRDR